MARRQDRLPPHGFKCPPPCGLSERPPDDVCEWCGKNPVQWWDEDLEAMYARDRPEELAEEVTDG
jgi:hypothetical protein